VPVRVVVLLEAVEVEDDEAHRLGVLERAAEIVEQLAARGIRLAGQARPHLLHLAALQGLICYGPDRGRDTTYVLAADWIKPSRPLPAEMARAELARRYLAGYAPAAPQDFSAWSGLPLSDARAAWGPIASQLVEVETAGAPSWLLKTQARWRSQATARHPGVRLLPGYDPYLLGYRSRALMVAAPYAKRIYPGGGLLRPTLLVDGRAAGTWRLKRQAGRGEVRVEPFADLAAAVRRELEAEVQDLGHFLGLETRLCVVNRARQGPAGR
jgi:hypothetical protein